MNNKQFDMMARPSKNPIIKGKNAKKLIEKLENPPNNRQLLEKYRKLNEIFEE